MTTENNTASRMAAGKAYREQMARSAHARIGTIDRDPIELLERNSQGRVEWLIPLRWTDDGVAFHVLQGKCNPAGARP